MYFLQKGKITKTTKQKGKHKTPCESRELNPGPLAPLYLSATEPSDRVDCSQAIKCFNLISRNKNKQSHFFGPLFFNTFCNILTCLDKGHIPRLRISISIRIAYAYKNGTS